MRFHWTPYSLGYERQPKQAFLLFYIGLGP